MPKNDSKNIKNGPVSPKVLYMCKHNYIVGILLAQRPVYWHVKTHSYVKYDQGYKNSV